MTRRNNGTSFGLVLLILLVGLGLLIVWLGIPIMVEKTFGEASTALTPFQP